MRSGAAVLAASLLVSACGVGPFASSPSTTVDPATCGVSELLVPDCGVWFGASTPSLDGTYDYARGLDEYEAVAGAPPDILHFYRTGGSPFPTPLHRSLAERPGQPRSILFFSWKPAPEITWRQIADGAADEAIASVAAGLAGEQRRFFLSIHHEPENDVIATPGSGMTPDDYVAMYRHVVDKLRSGGVDRAVFVMTYMGFERWASIVDALYPGDDVVDWIAYDPYGFARQRTFAELLNTGNAEGWPGFYEWATDRFPGRPIMVAEWGFDLTVQPEAPAALEDAPATLQRDFPAIKALVYWNDTARIDNRLLADGDEVQQAFAAAYAQLAGDPLFDHPPTDAAP